MDEPKKEVSFPVWDQETNEFIEITMDVDDYNAMVAYEEAYAKEQEERRKRRLEEEYAALRYDRDD
jgi:hypothetical protein